MWKQQLCITSTCMRCQVLHTWWWSRARLLLQSHPGLYRDESSSNPGPPPGIQNLTPHACGGGIALVRCPPHTGKLPTPHCTITNPAICVEFWTSSVAAVKIPSCVSCSTGCKSHLPLLLEQRHACLHSHSCVHLNDPRGSCCVNTITPRLHQCFHCHICIVLLLHLPVSCCCPSHLIELWAHCRQLSLRQAS